MKSPSIPASITFYEYTSQPRFWIAHDDQGYWLVPARTNGWAERHPFVGHVMNLRRVVDMEGIDLGMSAGHSPDKED